MTPEQARKLLADIRHDIRDNEKEFMRLSEKLGDLAIERLRLKRAEREYEEFIDGAERHQ